MDLVIPVLIQSSVVYKPHPNNDHKDHSYGLDFLC